jgi:hypothetical protein
MSIDPQSIHVGECYLTNAGKVRRVTALLPGRVMYEQRQGGIGKYSRWIGGILDLRSFAATVERTIAQNWMPESDKAPTLSEQEFS